MAPNKLLKVVTSGRADPVREDNSGPSDPVILVNDGIRADPVKLVTSGRSMPIRIVEDRRIPPVPPVPVPTIFQIEVSGEIAPSIGIYGGLYSGSILVDWGDGTQDYIVTWESILHEYSSSGTFTITFESIENYSNLYYLAFSSDQLTKIGNINLFDQLILVEFGSYFEEASVDIQMYPLLPESLEIVYLYNCSVGDLSTFLESETLSMLYMDWNLLDVYVLPEEISKSYAFISIQNCPGISGDISRWVLGNMLEILVLKNVGNIDGVPLFDPTGYIEQLAMDGKTSTVVDAIIDGFLSNSSISDFPSEIYNAVLPSSTQKAQDLATCWENGRIIAVNLIDPVEKISFDVHCDQYHHYLDIILNLDSLNGLGPIRIDWGDGTIENKFGSAISIHHEYSDETATYNMKISDISDFHLHRFIKTFDITDSSNIVNISNLSNFKMLLRPKNNLKLTIANGSGEFSSANLPPFVTYFYLQGLAFDIESLASQLLPLDGLVLLNSAYGDISSLTFDRGQIGIAASSISGSLTVFKLKDITMLYLDDTTGTLTDIPDFTDFGDTTEQIVLTNLSLTQTQIDSIIDELWARRETVDAKPVMLVGNSVPSASAIVKADELVNTYGWTIIYDTP